jgi:GNAT superfamily N-acetyltransferase
MRPEAIRICSSHGAEQLDVVRHLRYEVLRRPLGMPFEATLFDGDDLPSTQHLIAFDDIAFDDIAFDDIAFDRSRPLGCLTLLIPDSSMVAPDPRPIKVQLRGMAVLDRAQGRGIGSRMLCEVHQLASRRGWHLWCNARQSAVPFYAKNGWRIQGEPFCIPKIGMHFAMCWESRE